MPRKKNPTPDPNVGIPILTAEDVILNILETIALCSSPEQRRALKREINARLKEW